MFTLGPLGESMDKIDSSQNLKRERERERRTDSLQIDIWIHFDEKKWKYVLKEQWYYKFNRASPEKCPVYMVYLDFADAEIVICSVTAGYYQGPWYTVHAVCWQARFMVAVNVDLSNLSNLA